MLTIFGIISYSFSANYGINAAEENESETGAAAVSNNKGDDNDDNF